MGIPSVAEIMPRRKRGRAIARKQSRLDNIHIMDGLCRRHYRLLCHTHQVEPAIGWAPSISAIAGKELDHVGSWTWFLHSLAKNPPEHWDELPRMLDLMRGQVAEWRKSQQVRTAAIARRQAMLAAGDDGVEHADGFYASMKWKRLRYEVLRDAGGVCKACGRSRKHGVVLHVDHVMPRSLYPHLALEKSNLQVLCEDCNFGKGNHDETDWREHNR